MYFVFVSMDYVRCVVQNLLLKVNSQFIEWFSKLLINF